MIINGTARKSFSKGIIGYLCCLFNKKINFHKSMVVLKPYSGAYGQRSMLACIVGCFGVPEIRMNMASFRRILDIIVNTRTGPEQNS